MSLIHAEYLKISRRKLFPITLLVVALLMAMIGFISTVFGQFAPAEFGEIFIIDKPEAYAFGAQQAASFTWLPLVFTVAIFGSEFTTTVWATSLTRESSRLAQVGARLLIFTVAGWLAFIVGTAVFAAITWAAGAGTGAPPLSDWLGFLWRLGAVSFAWTALGLGAVAVMRSMVVALVATIGWSFVDSVVATFVDSYESISLTAASTGLFQGDLLGGPLASFVPGADLSTGHAAAIMAGWALFGFLLTWWGLQRRDA